jgi:hypothetical protein
MSAARIAITITITITIAIDLFPSSRKPLLGSYPGAYSAEAAASAAKAGSSQRVAPIAIPDKH